MNELKCQVIMLPTMDYLNSTIWHNPKSNHISFVSNKMRDVTTNYVPQHLYFIEKTSLNYNDWAINEYNKVVRVVENEEGLNGSHNKIIASTDKSLRLPLIPNKWIEGVFIPKQGKIGDIHISAYKRERLTNKSYPLKYEEITEIFSYWDKEIDIVPEIRESYTLEELEKAWNNGFGNGIVYDDSPKTFTDFLKSIQ